VQDRDIVAVKTNRRSHVDYQMAPLLVTFSDPESHFCCVKPFYLAYFGKYSVLSIVCLHMNRKVHMACNFWIVCLKMKDF